ncbi:MAG: methyltransferase domain-containing protein [Planctomycetota bacterium]
MEAHVYDQFAELEKTHFWFHGRREIFFELIGRSLKQAGLGDRSGSLDILEIGCGAGGMLEPLSRYGEVTALDFSHDAMAYCKKRGFSRVVAGSGTHVPFADQTFDLVALFDVIEHIEDHQGVLEEARRVLRPGGKVFLSVPAYQWLYSQNDHVVHHLRRYTASQLRDVVVAAGLRPEKVTYFNTFLFPLILPALVVLKLKERLFGRPEGETNLHHGFPQPINSAFGMVMSSEKRLLRHIEFPFGHSLIALAG